MHGSPLGAVSRPPLEIRAGVFDSGGRMAMSCDHLRAALAKSPPPVSNADYARYRETWANAYVGNSGKVSILDHGVSLEHLIGAAQDRFRRPHERWKWSWQPPIPFRWGPQGSLILLAGMMTAYAAVVAAILLVERLVP